MTATLLWFRRDLRLADNPALSAALDGARNLLPVYIHAPDEEAPWAPGAASRWWLHHSLTRLQSELRRRGSTLAIVQAKDSAQSLLQLCERFRCRRVVFNRLYEPAIAERDRRVAEALSEADIQTLNCPGNLIVEPGALHNQQGQPYRVFTPFWKTVAPSLDHLGSPDAAPLRLPPLPGGEIEQSVDALKLLPRIRWDNGLADAWTPGEAGGHKALDGFLGHIGEYGTARDRPDQAGTSRLSPYLHFGELSARQIVHGVRFAREGRGSESYLRELGWREFAHHLLHHFPHTPDSPLDARFESFPWRRSKKDLQRWQRGETGIPFVDAGMRELWHTGWMHNRVRMVVASFLTKHLRLPWQWGAAWFWDTLVDADLANNTLGWQWTAGCGADAAPYFRVFNPVLQAGKFDPEGDYIRRWIPELAALPTPALYEPWKKKSALQAAGIRLGQDYPAPMVDLAEGRRAALAAYETIKKS